MYFEVEMVQNDIIDFEQISNKEMKQMWGETRGRISQLLVYTARSDEATD